SRDIPVREIMTERVDCVRPEQTVEQCMGLMTDKRIRHLPELQSKRVVGVISIGDVVKEMLVEKEFVIQQLERRVHSGTRRRPGLPPRRPRPNQNNIPG